MSYSKRQLYALGETLGDSVTVHKVGGGRIYGGGGSSGGGSSGTTTTANQYSSVSPWAQPYVSDILGAAQQQVFNTDSSGNITGINPYTAYGQTTGVDANGNPIQAGINSAANAAAQASVAGFSPLQQQSFNTAANMTTPGQFSTATNAAQQGTQQALGAGQNLQNTLTNSNAMSQYMNPYIQNTLAPSLALSNQQYGQAAAQEQGAATGAGAFGGSREALMQGLNQQSNQLANNQLISNAYNNAYTNAQTQANNVANLGLQGAQAGITGANALSNIGTSQLAAQTGIAGLQNTYGTQQQQNQQNIINQAMQNYSTAQAYPMTQLSNLKTLTSGLPMTDVTTTQQAAAPTTLSQLTGLGTAGIGAYGLMNSGNTPVTNVYSTPTTSSTTATSKKGGILKAKKKKVKSYSEGGLVSLSLYNVMKDAA